VRGILFKPLRGGLRDFFTSPFKVSGIDSLLPTKIERAVIDVEALIQAELPVKNESAHEGCRAVTARLENCRESYGPTRERFGVILHTVPERVSGSQQGDMRRQGQGDLGVYLSEQRASPGDGVDMEGLKDPIAIAIEMVGPQGVNGNQYNGRRSMRLGRESCAGGEQLKKYQDRQDLPEYRRRA